jgi:hypothetical protein
MRKVMVMNGRIVEHNGKEYVVKSRTFNTLDKEEAVQFTTPHFKDVFDSLLVQFDSIDLDEGITEDEIKYLYFGFDGLKEKIDKHFRTTRNYYRLMEHELELVLENMTRFRYARLDAHFHSKPFLGFFGDYESLKVSGKGKCFHKPTMMGDQKIKIENSHFSYAGNASLSVGFEGRSLWLQIYKNSRKTIQIDFVPHNKKHEAKRREEAI